MAFENRFFFKSLNCYNLKGFIWNQIIQNCHSIYQHTFILSSKIEFIVIYQMQCAEIK